MGNAFIGTVGTESPPYGGASFSAYWCCYGDSPCSSKGEIHVSSTQNARAFVSYGGAFPHCSYGTLDFLVHVEVRVNDWGQGRFPTGFSRSRDRTIVIRKTLQGSVPIPSN